MRRVIRSPREQLRDPTQQHGQLMDLVRQRWVALAQKMNMQANPVQFVISAVGAPGVSAGAPGMPAELRKIPAWYAREYERKVCAQRKELLHLSQPQYRDHIHPTITMHVSI